MGSSQNLYFRWWDNGSAQGWQEVWTSANDGSGSGLDADTLDGINSGSFLRSDANDTYTGTLTLGTNTSIKLPNSASYGIRTSTGQRVIDSVDSTLRIGDTAKHNIIRLHGQGSDDFRVYYGATDYQIFHQGNDGSGSGLDADTLDGIQASSFLRSDATDTATGTITFSGGINVGDLSNGGITGSNYNITGVNTLVMNDPGEGIQFAGTSNVHLAAIDDSTDSVMNFANASELRVNNNKVWTVSNDGSGSGLDADLLDGVHASSFLRSDATDSASGTLSLNGRVNIGDGLTRPAALNSDSAAHLKVGGSDVHLYVASLNATGGYKVAVQAARDSDFASFTLNLQSNGGALQRGGNTVWDAGNDGSGSGLDADTVDGIQGGSFLRSDATDTFGSQLSSANNVPIRFVAANATDTNDGKIGAGVFASGLNIVGAQTSSGTGRQVRIWGDVITDAGNKFWNAGNDGAGSGLDADLLDGQHGSYYTGSKGVNNNYVASSSSTSNRGNFGAGVWAYSGYSTGSNRPFTYDATLQVMPASNLGFEFSVDWVSQSSTPLKVRSLRDCCQGWSSYSTVWTSSSDGSGSGLDADTVDGIQASSFLRSDASDTATGSITLGSSTKLLFGNSSNYGVGAGGHNYRSVYVDTLESGLSNDPLELVYYQGPKVNIGPGGNKPMNAGSFEIGGTSVINSSRYLGNIARFYFQNNFSGTYLEAEGSYLEINTATGYTRIGSGNSTYSHFWTDRGRYYFNKRIQVDEGIVQSHNEDLQLRRTNSSNDRVVIGDTVIQFFLDGSEDMRLTNNGNLDVEGDVTAFSTVVASDERLKDDVLTIKNAVDKVSQLRGVEFVWNKGKREGKQDIGVIAQEVEKVLPEVVIEKELPLMEEGTTYKTVDYPKLTAVLIEAIKEQQEEIKELKEHSHKPKNLDEMEGFDSIIEEINSLKSEIKRLKGE